MTTETMTIETGQLRRACEIMQTLRNMPNVKDIPEIESSLCGLIKALDPGPPIEEVAGPPENGHLEGRSVIEAGSTEIQYRYAKECIGIAVVELNRAYAEFDIDGNGNIITLPTRRIQEADRLLSTARKHLDIHLDDLNVIPF